VRRACVRRLGLAAALGWALLFGGCKESEPEILVFEGVRMGEVWPGPEKKLYSQGNEELLIRDFFGDRRDGFFLDVGCSEPVDYTTTYYLEKHLGWSGIGIDALPDYAEAYRQTRPRTVFENYLVTDHSGTTEAFYKVPGVPGLSSTDPKRTFAGKELVSERIEIPTITLDDLLEKHGVEEIDFLSMDIEGSEPQALSGFDIERFRPELVCIEFSDNGPWIESYFSEHGYERIEEYRRYDYVNWYFRPAEAKPGGSGG